MLLAWHHGSIPDIIHELLRGSEYEKGALGRCGCEQRLFTPAAVNYSYKKEALGVVDRHGKPSHFGGKAANRRARDTPETSPTHVMCVRMVPRRGTPGRDARCAIVYVRCRG